MPTIQSSAAAEAAARTLGDFEAFLLRLGDRDRLNVERHVAFCETESTPAHAQTWKRLACVLARLAPHAALTTGQRAVRFFVADGKYRLQLFAQAQPNRALEPHRTEMRARPRHREHRLVQAAARHRLRAKAVAAAQHDRDQRNV